MALPDITYIRTRFNLLHAKREFDSEDYNHLDKVLRFAQVAEKLLPKMLASIEELDAYDVLSGLPEPDADALRDASKQLRDVMK